MVTDSLVRSYPVYLAASGKSPHTADWHRHCLGQFVRWLAAHGHHADPDHWTPTLIRQYLVYQQQRTKANGESRSEASLNSMARSLRAFYAWLLAEEFATADPFARAKVPKGPILVKATLSAGDTGARANEVCTLKLADVDWDRRIAKLYGEGAKERYVPVSAYTAKSMQRYQLRERKCTGERFFESEEGAPLTTSGLRQICKRVGRRAQPPQVSPHVRNKLPAERGRRSSRSRKCSGTRAST